MKPPHIVTIYTLPTGTHAVLEPGILEADRGDVIEFRNQTSSLAQLVVAQERILERVPPMAPQDIDGGQLIGRAVELGRQDRSRDQPEQHSLQEEDLEEADPPEVFPPLLPERPIAVVLSLAPVPPQDVQ